MASRSAARSSRIRAGTSPGALRARRKFLRFFPDGFYDETYLDWERNYKVAAHERFCERLPAKPCAALLREGRHAEAAALAVKAESRTHLLFSFEKMALRDAVREENGARAFAEGLHEYVYGPAPLAERFDRWCDVVAGLPRIQTRVLTWP